MLDWVASILAGVHLRFKTSASTEKALNMSNASAQMKLVRKETTIIGGILQPASRPFLWRQGKYLQKMCTG